MSVMSREFWFAGRLLLRTPGFTLIALATLALAIGACTAIYSVVYGVMLRPLPYPHSEQLVQLWQLDKKAAQSPFSDPNFEDVRSQTGGFESVAEFNQGTSSVLVGNLPLRVPVATVSRDFPEVFRTDPGRGRWFADDELREGARSEERRVGKECRL